MDRKLRKKQLAVKMANNQLKILSVFDKKKFNCSKNFNWRLFSRNR